MDLKFGLSASQLKRIAIAQMAIDTQFTKEMIHLKAKLYSKKISGSKFWEEYKKALLKSVEKNKKTVTTLLKKTDKKMKDRLKQAEQEEKTGQNKKPLIDLKLPE